MAPVRGVRVAIANWLYIIDWVDNVPPKRYTEGLVIDRWYNLEVELREVSKLGHGGFVHEEDK